MGRKLTKEELEKHKKDALNKMEKYLDSLIDDSDPKANGKADKLSYWLEDWTTFLDFEPNFSPSSLRKYKRGEIIKAHLGYNVGSEEGGLHYCVVVEKNNSKNSPVLTVVPLTSVKDNVTTIKLHKGCVYLGNELYVSLSKKTSNALKMLQEKVDRVQKTIDALSKNSPIDAVQFKKDLEEYKTDLEFVKRMQNETEKMKHGSIALVGQIKTISKIRIYDPKTNFDILSNVKLSSERLDCIDNEIISNFTNNKVDYQRATSITFIDKCI